MPKCQASRSRAAAKEIKNPPMIRHMEFPRESQKKRVRAWETKDFSTEKGPTKTMESRKRMAAPSHKKNQKRTASSLERLIGKQLRHPQACNRNHLPEERLLQNPGSAQRARPDSR